MSKFENIICNRAFTQLNINLQTGMYLPCCIFSYSKKFDISSDFHKEIRQNNLENMWAKGCDVCKKNEDVKSQSHRLQYNDIHPTNLEQISENTIVLKHLELMLDNNCNCACITCHSGSSSKWQSEINRMDKIKKSYENITENNYDYLFDLNLWKNVETLVLFGGEPLYSKKTKKILDWLITNNLSRNISLSFYTNGTIFSLDTIKKFQKFKKIDLQFSIDSTEKNFEIIRWPAKYNTVIDNLKKYNALDNVSVSINYTISILNIFNVEKDYKILKKICNKINFNFVENPDYYSIVNLPDIFKSDIKEELSRNPKFNNIVKKLELSGLPEKFTSTFPNLKKLDKFRNTDSLSLFPQKFIDFYQKNP